MIFQTCIEITRTGSFLTSNIQYSNCEMIASKILIFDFLFFFGFSEKFASFDITNYYLVIEEENWTDTGTIILRRFHFSLIKTAQVFSQFLKVNSINLWKFSTKKMKWGMISIFLVQLFHFNFKDFSSDFSEKRKQKVERELIVGFSFRFFFWKFCTPHKIVIFWFSLFTAF